MDVFIGDSVKATPTGHVSGYLVRFGNEDGTDLTGDYFTKSTDFGFPVEKELPINLYYNHGFDSKVKNRSIGTATVKMDDIGLWLEGQLDIAESYARAIAKLASEGKLGLSSGASNHLSARKAISDGIAEITQWTLAEASLTPSPAEWRNTVKSVTTSELSNEVADTLPTDLALESLRDCEKHLGSIGCSRRDAKRLAPNLWDALRDADEPEDKHEDKHDGKSDEKERLIALLEVMETV